MLFDDAPGPNRVAGRVDLAATGAFAVVHVELGWSRNDVHVIDVASGERRTVIADQEVVTWLTVDDRRNRLVGHTTLDADRGRVVAVPLDGESLEPSRWQTLVPESDAVIEGTALTRDSLLVASTTARASRTSRITVSDGRSSTKCRCPSSVRSPGCATSRDDDVAVFSFTGFARPPTCSDGRQTAAVDQWSDLPGRPTARVHRVAALVPVD